MIINKKILSFLFCSSIITAGAYAADYDDYYSGDDYYSEDDRLSFEEVLEAIQNNTREQIDSYCNKEEISILANAFASNTGLKSLCINGPSREMGIIDFATSLELNTTLESLSLCGCKITNQAGEALGNALTLNKTLKKLELSGSISLAGILALAKALKENEALMIVSLNFGIITDEAAVALADVIKSNTRLNELDFNHNEFTDEAKSLLAQALKLNVTLIKLEINNYDDFDSLESPLMKDVRLELVKNRMMIQNIQSMKNDVKLWAQVAILPAFTMNLEFFLPKEVIIQISRLMLQLKIKEIKAESV